MVAIAPAPPQLTLHGYSSNSAQNQNLIQPLSWTIESSSQNFSFECPDGEVWIPLDQTLHWGKRPTSLYPQVKLNKSKGEIPKIPRGRHLVARVLPPTWYYESSVLDTQGKLDPLVSSCLEDEKTIVPFEKGAAVFRHLRVSKALKLKGTESALITSLTIEIGHHNAFDSVPFKSLGILLAHAVKIHLVPHKRSVEIMQRHGILPYFDLPKRKPKQEPQAVAPSDNLLSLSPESAYQLQQFLNDALIPDNSLLTHVENSTPQTIQEQIRLTKKRALEITNMMVPLEETTPPKKQKSLHEIMDEVFQIQRNIDMLGDRVQQFCNFPSTNTIRVYCNPEVYPPSIFAFYAFRTKDMGLALTMTSRIENFDINMKDQKGYTLLHTAAKFGFLEGVMWCLFNSADVNATSNSGSTALHFAYQRNDKKIKKALKESGASKDILNVYQMKPKDYKNSRRPLSTYTLSFGARVEVVMEGVETPFGLTVWFAARIGWLEVVSMYMENLNMDVDAKNSNGQTALMCAAEYGRANVVEYLLKKGSDPNARDIHDRTPLHYAYLSGDSYITTLLEQHGADPSLNNLWQRTPEFYQNSPQLSP